MRARLIDKDNSPRWDPPTLELVTDEMVDALFQPAKHELALEERMQAIARYEEKAELQHVHDTLNRMSDELVECEFDEQAWWWQKRLQSGLRRIQLGSEGDSATPDLAMIRNKVLEYKARVRAARALPCVVDVDAIREGGAS